jgi:hypothetical protein
MENTLKHNSKIIVNKKNFIILKCKIVILYWKLKTNKKNCLNIEVEK